jgi:hypothetical protein
MDKYGVETELLDSNEKLASDQKYKIVHSICGECGGDLTETNYCVYCKKIPEVIKSRVESR